MNIGDGLTIQTRSVNGKVSTGIFLAPSNAGKEPKTKFNYKSRTVKYPIRSKIEPTQTTQNFGDGSKLNTKGSRPRNTVNRSQETKPNDDAQKKQTVPKKSQKESDNLDVESPRPKKEVAGNNASRLRSQKYQKKPNIVEGKKLQNVKNPGTVDDSENVSTKFVTLTQDQLNTILSLVKTKHDIDVSAVLTDGDSKPQDDTEIADHDSDKTVTGEKNGEVVEPDSVPGLDLGTETRGGDTTKEGEGKALKSEKIDERSMKRKRKSKEGTSGKKKGEGGKEGEKDEPPEKDVKEATDGQNMKQNSGYDACGALGGFGSREQEKEKIEAKRQEWIKGLVEQVKQTEQMREERKQQRKGSEKQPEINENSNEEKENIENITKRRPDSGEKKGKKPKQPARSAPPSAKMSARAHKTAASVQKIEPAPERRSQENLPAAIRSSFFTGEAVPREHAFSATKREQQRRWKEELDKQRLEQNRRREEEKEMLRRAPDAEGTAWTRHFDTMLPVKSSFPAENPVYNTPERDNVVPGPSAAAYDIRSASDSQIENPTIMPQEMTSPRESAGISLMNNIYRGEHTTAAPGGGSTNYDQQRSSYLRTMTSLLDPAQIEALEVKRKKQEEHRRAIAAQVEERKRKKEEEQNLQKRLEMEEDMRLAAERDALAQKNEVERMKHQMRENIREQKTQQLYHQMQEAQESALRDKLSQREQQLRNRGHDTSRLEKTHQITLETNKKVVDSAGNPAHASQTSIMSTSSSLHVPAMNLPPQTYTANTTPRQAFVTVDERSPVSVTADTGSGPIKLEITVNKQQNQGDVVETGVQTDVAEEFNGRLIFDSDQETEYLPLPRVRTKKSRPQKGEEKKGDKRNTKQSLQKYEKNLEKQYDRYSRTNRNQANDANQTSPITDGGNAKQRKSERKPQWGVGPKKKEFVPASKRYVDNAKWQRKHEANVRRREEQLLEQQALNNPERLREIASHMRDKDDSPTGGRHSPPVPTVAHRMENTNKGNRRARSYSPQKRDVHDHRSRSPPVPARRWQKEQPQRRGYKDADRKADRPESVVSATTEQAKYRGSKHTRESPIPQTNDFVEYRRTSTILNPNQVDSRPVSGADHGDHPAATKDHRHLMQHHTHSDHHDPLYNPNMVRQRDRQEQILREISILRQGLLLKQREVASYPATMTHSIAAMPQANLVLAGGGNLPERTNDTPLM